MAPSSLFRRGVLAALVALVALLCVASGTQAAGTNCDTQSKLTLESGTTWNTQNVGVEVTPAAGGATSSSTMRITDSRYTDTAFAQYTTEQYRVVNGFRATFNFRVAQTSAEGFAFVLQASSPIASGGSSNNLGYAFARNIAVEFDMRTAPSAVMFDTPGNNHVEVHTLYGSASANSASSAGAQRLVPNPSYTPGVTMNSGATYAVTINYVPATVASSPTGRIDVQVGGGTVITTSVNSDSIASMFANGMAYVGFTGSTSSFAADIFVTNFQLYTVPVSAPDSTIISSVSSMVASNVFTAAAQVRVQLRDACGSPITVSQGASAVTATFTGASGSQNVQVQDAGAGVYAVYAYSTYSGAAPTFSSTCTLTIKYLNTNVAPQPINIASQPMLIAVTPSIPHGPSSTISPALPSTFVAGTAQAFTVTVNDFLGNPTPLGAGFSIKFGFPADNPDLETKVAPNPSQPHLVPINLVSNTARSSTTVLVRVHNDNVAPDVDLSVSPKSDVSVTAGAPRGITSDLTSSNGALSSLEANDQGVITLAVKDSMKNAVIGQGFTVTGTLNWVAGQAGSVPAVVNLAVFYKSDNLWQLTYSTKRAGSYTINVRVAGEALSGSYGVFVTASDANKADVTTVVPSGTAGSLTKFTMQVYDQDGNARAEANPSANGLSVTLTPEGQATSTVDCGSSAAFTPTTYLGSFACVYSTTVGGQYVVTATPLKSLKYTIGAKVGSTASTITPANSQFAVVAGPASVAVGTSVVTGVVDAVSGVAKTFQVTVKDAYGNLRTGNDDTSALTAQLSGSGLPTVVASVTSHASGVYTFTFTASLVGSYALSVKLNSATVPAAVSTVVVTPGDMVPLNSLVYGQGLTGGVGDTTTTITIQARDVNGNNLATSLGTNTFTVAVTLPSNAAFNPRANVTAGTNGLYTVAYWVPPYTQPNTFVLTIKGSLSGGTASGVGSATGQYNAFTGQNSGQASKALATGQGLVSATAGVPSTFQIDDKDQSGTSFPDGSSLSFFTVTFTRTDDPSAPEVLTTAFCPVGRVANCNPKTVSWVPSSKAEYKISITADGGLQTVQSQAGLKVTVGPGVLSPPNTVLTAITTTAVAVGQTFMYKVQLSDAQGNALTTSAGATISFPTTPTPPYTVNSAVDNLDGTFTVSITFGKSGLLVVSPLINNQSPTKGLPVNVDGGPVDGSRSSWTGAGTVVAGSSTGIISILLYDAYNNPITNGRSISNGAGLGCKLVVAGQPVTMVQTFTQSDSVPNSYTITFNPTVSDYLATQATTLTCGGVSMTNPATTTQTRVIPALASPGNSAVIGMPSTSVANEPVSFTLRLRDGLGNPWIWRSFDSVSISNALQVTVSATLPWKPLQVNNALATVTRDMTRPGEGYYLVSYTPQFASPGDYTFKIIAEGVGLAVQTGLQSLRVLAGPPFMPYAMLPSCSGSSTSNGCLKPGGDKITAGVSYTLAGVRLVDAQLNPHATGGLASQLDMQFYKKYSSAYCAGVANGVAVKDTSHSVPVNDSSIPTSFWVDAVVDNGDGTYDFTFTGYESGDYWFDIVFGGDILPNAYISDCSTNPAVCYGNPPRLPAQPKDCESIGYSTAFTIVPAAISPEHTLYERMDPADAERIFGGRAGDPLSFNVTLRDRFNNSVTAAQATGITPMIGDSTDCTSLEVGEIVLDEVTNSIAVTTSSAGLPKYTVAFTASGAGKYRIPVMVNGVLASDDGACPRLTVGPAAIAQVTVVPLAGATVWAGIPAVYEVQTRDQFGNTITADSSYRAPVFNVTFQRQGGLGSYYSVWNTTIVDGTQFLLPISFMADGAMDVTITLVPDALMAAEDLPAGDHWPVGSAPVIVVPVASAACAAMDSQKPYRCGDYSCVADYASCGASYNACPVGTSLRCPSDPSVCVASLIECSICPNMTDYCSTGANSGYCAPRKWDASTNTTVSSCPQAYSNNFCPEDMPVPCGTPTSGICRKTAGDCPSNRACPPYTSICPDGRSCVKDPAKDCPPIPTTACTSETFPFQCRDGSCVPRLEDCATERTCAPGFFLCPDDTCRSSAAECTETFSCLFDQVKCPNGECRHRLTDCPSAVTCPPGWVRCENGACVDEVTECPNDDSLVVDCTLSASVRCPDGTCRRNRLQCPTLPTCPPHAPVQCSDHSCVRDVVECRAPRQCPESAPFLCPENTCVAFNTSCPTRHTCPPSAPTRCPDGSCREGDCHMHDHESPCPAHKPFRCADSTCAGSWAQCPTRTVACDRTYPVLCPDGSCVASVEMCSKIGNTPCVEGTVRCPAGGCAPARDMCPTPVACGTGFVRGQDGSCHKEVNPSTRSNTTDLYSFTMGFTVQCGAGVRCPQAHQGETCAPELSQCPQDVTCPRSRPVRCSDASCALSLEDCPVVQEVSNRYTVCAAGSTSSDINCHSSVTCTSAAPIKCWDESCRVHPDDCPPQAKCAKDTPYLCSSGVCVEGPGSCALPACNTAVAAGQAPKTLKCPFYRECVYNVTECPNIFKAWKETDKGCPFARCRDGFCSTSEYSCANMACPAHIPYRCADGLCVGFAEECRDLSTGCSYFEPIKCADGSCAKNDLVCKARADAMKPCDPDNSGNVPDRCPDGSCPGATEALACKTTVTGCGEDEILCLDGTCAPKKSTYDDAVSGCVDRTDAHNACPAWRPYRCADGYCAVSSTQCPIIPYSVDMLQPVSVKMSSSRRSSLGLPNGAELELTVRCADGSMVAFSAQCPTLRPCTGGKVRCDNGQCRDFCPATNPCLTRFPKIGTIQGGVRCATGHCAPSDSMCMDIATTSDPAAGCPKAAPLKCTTGLIGKCVSSTVDCMDPQGVQGEKCWDGSIKELGEPCPAFNGCPGDKPFLCAGGECRATPDCPAGSPSDSCSQPGYFRCPNGQCQPSWSSCKLTNGCPVNTPIRCASGGCAAKRATLEQGPDECPAIVVCDANTPYKCADQSCVSSPSFCRPLWPCPPAAGQACPGLGAIASCIDTTGMMSNSTCPVGLACPPTSPVLCGDGRCTTSVAQCSDVAQPTCPDMANKPLRCFDGSCVSSPMECAEISFTVNRKYTSGAPAGGYSFNPDARLDNSTCADNTLHLCPDGSCVEQEAACRFVPACPALRPLRCWNGQCINSTASSCPPKVSCPVGTSRCEDGGCRTKCLPFAGCPLSQPYACTGRKISCTADEAQCVGLPVSRRRLLQSSESTGQPQETCINCQNALQAPFQTVSLSSDMDQLIDVVVDEAFVPRTQVLIPAGAVPVQSASVSIYPVQPASLPCYSTFSNVEAAHHSGQCQTSIGPFLYSSNVLSTPFRLSVDAELPGARQLQGPVTVMAQVDIKLYDAAAAVAAAAGQVVVPTVPCELQGSTFSVKPDPVVYTPGGTLKYGCTGALTLSATGMRMRMDPSCDSIDLEGTYTGQGGSVLSSWNRVSSRTCNCFNITRSTPHSPQPRPLYPPKTLNSSLPNQEFVRWNVGKTVCFYVARNVNAFKMAVYTPETLAASVCPFNGRTPNALFFEMGRSNTTDECGNRGLDGNVAPDDICLATINDQRNGWKCLLESREARLNAPTWSSDSGRPQARVVGTVSTDRHAVLAFAYIPLPPAAVEKAPSCDLWCEYKAVILGVVIGMGAFIAIATYAIIRLRRYRAKYKENQRNLQELKERAREIDEFAGGIGLADEAGEVDMVANPMVIEMKKLDQQLTEVNDQLNTQAEKDNRRIDQLSQERERLNAELNRMRAALAAQTRTAATRLEDVHISQPHYDASSAAVGSGGGGAGGLTSSGLVPMEMETPARQEIEGYSADQQRHGFGQVRRPNKKKSDF